MEGNDLYKVNIVEQKDIPKTNSKYHILITEVDNTPDGHRIRIFAPNKLKIGSADYYLAKDNKVFAIIETKNESVQQLLIRLLTTIAHNTNTCIVKFCSETVKISLPDLHKYIELVSSIVDVLNEELK